MTGCHLSEYTSLAPAQPSEVIFFSNSWAGLEFSSNPALTQPAALLLVTERGYTSLEVSF